MQKITKADIWIKKLDETLIKAGYKPTIKGNKTGSFIHFFPKNQNKIN